MKSWLVVEGSPYQKDITLVLHIDGRPGKFTAIGAESAQEAARLFLTMGGTGGVEACLVFPLENCEQFRREVKAVKP